MLRPTWMFMGCIRKKTYQSAQYKTKNCLKLDVDPQRDDDASPMSTYRCM